jgi:hypothetical protein
LKPRDSAAILSAGTVWDSAAQVSERDAAGGNIATPIATTSVFTVRETV